MAEDGETLVADCETDNLLDGMTRLWCVQLGSADGDDSILYGDVEFCDRPLAEGLERMRKARRLIFHNGLGFDLWAINKVHPDTVRFDQVLDTLVLARMAFITERNHSLDAWGKRTGTMKGSFKGPYDVWTKEFADYSRQDIPAGRALWHKVKHALEWGDGKVYETEARAAYCISMQEQTGFAFDVAAAEKLHGELAQEMADLSGQIRKAFPDFKREHTFTPKASNSKYGYVKGVPFTKKWDDEFNPRSRQMIAEALIRDGWKPTEFTPTGQPKVDAETLAGHRHPGAQLLVRYLRLSKILGAILGEKAGKGYLQLVKPDGRIHGRVNSLGAVTWRMTHSNPNSANVDKDPRVRSLFVASPGRVLVGVDGVEIQARFLAHYLHRYDNGVQANKLLRGDKKLGTDGHSLNLVALKPFGLVDRDGAKTALYARIFGCRFPRMFETINENRRDNDLPMLPQRDQRKVGQGAIDALGRAMPGLDDLLRDVQTTGKARGWLKGIGGAQVPCSAIHSALVSLLQHGEAVAMKMALGIFQFEEAPKRGWRHWDHYWFVGNIHDETQTETLPEIAEEAGAVFSECIAEAGRRLNMRCPLAGEAKIGKDWGETH